MTQAQTGLSNCANFSKPHPDIATKIIAMVENNDFDFWDMVWVG